MKSSVFASKNRKSTKSLASGEIDLGEFLRTLTTGCTETTLIYSGMSEFSNAHSFINFEYFSIELKILKGLGPILQNLQSGRKNIRN